MKLAASTRILRLVFFIPCLLLGTLSFAQTPSFIRDSLDSYIERNMRQWRIPGLSIAIVKDGKVILSKGYGVREFGKEEKVDENTLFIIASNSKLFTGTSLAKLDFEKKLSLNDKVTQYIPWFRLYDSNSTRMATIKDMLCHRLGTKTFQGDFTFWDSNLPKDSILWKMRYLKPPGQFRQDYGYCNSGFLVAGQVLEKVTGLTWEKYVEDNIIGPLGMSNTYMNTAGLAERKNVASPHNNLYSPLTKIPFDNVDNLGPATSMVSNVKDLTHWLLMQLDSGRYEGKRILPWEVLQKTRDINILTGSRKSTVYPTHFRGYGLGVYSTDYNGRQVYWHTGGAFGHVTNVCFVPEEKLGITILTNNDNQNFFEALRYQILDAYLGVAYTDRSKFQWGFFVQGQKEVDAQVQALKTRVERKNTMNIPLDEFTGDYFNTIYGKISISKADNRLICRFGNHPDLVGYMDYMDNDEFRVTYSNIGYGIYPAKFSLKDGKPVAVEIKSNDFVESDAYLFVKDPAGLMIR
ncbi:MAG TPA: serine hydrolase [Chitinophagaceae bacterium]|jgi:CubicO group peptidase (beta-lactamase class C family)|nr:serine hydrolase [Chitinophagaceae bacterium]